MTTVRPWHRVIALALAFAASCQPSTALDDPSPPREIGTIAGSGFVPPALLVSSLLKSSNVFCENEPSGLVLMISDAFNTQTPP